MIKVIIKILCRTLIIPFVILLTPALMAAVIWGFISPIFLLIDVLQYLYSGSYDSIRGITRLKLALENDYWNSWLGSPDSWWGAHKILMWILDLPSGLSALVLSVGTLLLIGGFGTLFGWLWYRVLSLEIDK